MTATTPATRSRPGRRLGITPILAASLLAASGLSACGSSDGGEVSSITVSGAWARPTPPGASSGVVYFDLVSPIDDELTGVSVSADVASSAGLHETVGGDGGEAMPNMPGMDMGDGMSAMQDLASVPVAAQARVRFEPGGKHVMLEGLVDTLDAGSTVTLTLTFRSGATVTVDAIVADDPPD